MQTLKNIFQRLFGRWSGNPQDQNFYVKLSFATVAGLICGITSPFFVGVRGLVFGLLVYILSLYVLVYLVEVDVAALGGRQKLIVNSLPSYLLLWVLLWTLIYSFTVTV